MGLPGALCAAQSLGGCCRVSNLEAKLLESSREHEAKDHRLADLETRLLGAIQSDHLKVCPVWTIVPGFSGLVAVCGATIVSSSLGFCWATLGG